MTTPKLTVKERIESHIISRDNCWITDYKTDSHGRPRIMIDKKSCKLARVVYEIYKDDILGDQLVCHRCDNLLCINPDQKYVTISGIEISNILCQPKKKHIAVYLEPAVEKALIDFCESKNLKSKKGTMFSAGVNTVLAEAFNIQAEVKSRNAPQLNNHVRELQADIKKLYQSLEKIKAKLSNLVDVANF
jgi:hypothetical protein